MKIIILVMFLTIAVQAQSSNSDSLYIKQLEHSVILLYEQLSEACHYGYAYETSFNDFVEKEYNYFVIINRLRLDWLDRNRYLYERCLIQEGVEK